MRAVVLCYHGNNIAGNDYLGNDLVALAQDLRLIHALGLPILPLHGLVDALRHRDALRPCVGLSFDDGTDFDWHDLVHPEHGPQRSIANTLRDFERETGQRATGTSFVIASPEARAHLGQGRWINEDWWPAAVDSGLLAIENHSWDHQHESLLQRVSGLPGGSFANITRWAQADAEIRQATAYLDARLPQRRTRLFAYPYGHFNDYLMHEYLPGHGHEHGLQAAFSTEPEPITAQSSRWCLGRYVCGYHWRSPEGLQTILREALGRA